MARKNETIFHLPAKTQSPGEALTAQFYDWERRGRGWQLWPVPVQLEPPFEPFFFHSFTPPPIMDDGRRPGLVSSLIARLPRWLKGAAAPGPQVAEPQEGEEDEPLPELDLGNQPLTEFQLTLPAGFKSSKPWAEEFLIGLSPCSGPFSFELIGRSGEIVVQLTCRERDRAALRSQLAAYFPEAALSEEPAFLSRAWREAASDEPVIVDFGLSEEFMAPLRTVPNFDHDPLVGLAGALSDLEEDEIGVLQILYEPARRPWAESIYRSVTDPEGKPFFLDAPELVAQAKEKISRPLYAAVIRVAAQSPEPGRAWQIAQGLGRGLGTLANLSVNELMPLANDDYDGDLHETDLLERTSCRSGMLLSSDELLSLVHLPGASVRSPKLRRETRKTKAAPALSAGHPFILGENVHNGRTVEVTLSPVQRLRHMHVIGASGTGKSTFLLNMILQDIENGKGLAVLDPHGDLIDAILARIPRERWDDVVLLDPSDEEFPVGFNILSAHSELEKHLLASDLAAVFRRLSTSWGDQMSSVLGNAILAFLESERGGTLADLRRFLVEKDYREEFLQTVRDREVVYYWQKEFPMLTGKPQGPLLTRLDIFLRPKPIRHMVAQKENKLDFAGIMNKGQIFLAKLSQGAIGEENAFLLGTLLVSKFHQLALSRQETAEASRRDFYLYVDEFHNFVTPSMASILSGARKYHLGLILAHQEMRQIGRDSEVAAAVLANPYARVCFRLGDEDARKLESGFAFFEAKDLQNLGTGEALCRLERADYDFNLKTAPLEPVDELLADGYRWQIILRSRQRYGVRRDQVEAELERNRPAPREAPPTKKRTEPAPAATAATPALPPAPPPLQPADASLDSRPLPPTPAEPVSPAVTPPLPPPQEELPPGPTARPRERARLQPAAVPETAERGRGGQQHKYLQQFVKQLTEGMGWRAEIEKQILDGAGSVDVALTKGKVTVACEISVTTGVEQEISNLEKCLKAGFSYVVALSQEGKQLEKLKAAATKRLGEGLERLRFLTKDDIPAFIASLEPQAAAREGTVRGYKTKTNYHGKGAKDESVKLEALSDVVVNRIKKMKK